MKPFASLALLICGATALAAAPVPTNAPTHIELRDQFEMTRTLAFPTTNLTLLTIADKKGSEQIAGWVSPVKQKYDSRINIAGIADLSSVPRPLRGLVRKQFRKAETHPVMLDWSGDTVKRFHPKVDQAGIFLIAESGRILWRCDGSVSEKGLEEMFVVIEAVFANGKQPANQ